MHYQWINIDINRFIVTRLAAGAIFRSTLHVSCGLIGYPAEHYVVRIIFTRSIVSKMVNSSAFMGNFETAISHKILVICKNIERQWILLEGQLLVDCEFLYIRGKFRSVIFHKIRYITVNCGIYGKFQDAKKICKE